MRFTTWLNALRYRSVQSSPRGSRRGSATVAIVEILESRKLLSTIPVIANVGPTMNYTEGAPALPVANHATITDASTAFANSKLTVTTTNGATGDLLGVLNGAGVGMGPNGAVVFATSPTATPVQIGSAVGGAGNSALIVSFNSHATQASVQAVLDEVGYGNGTSTLQTLDRQVSIVFTDGNRVASAPVVKGIHLVPAPVIGITGTAPVNYIVNASPVVLAPAATIADAATGGFANSKLVVQLGGGAAEGHLGIKAGGALTLGANSTLLYNNMVVGSFSGGTGSQALVITFNASANHDSVQAVLQNITFAYKSTSATPVVTNRQATFNFTDHNNVSAISKVQGIHVTK